MVGRIARGTVSAVAALSIAAGGAVLAGGTAAGQGSSAGGESSWWLDEVHSNLAPSCDLPGINTTCYQSRFFSGDFLGDYTTLYTGPKEVAPGAERIFTATVGAREAAFDVPNPSEDVDVTSVTYLPPKGFTFVGVKVTAVTYNPSRSAVDLDSTVSIDPDSGEVTVTAPDGGWSLEPGQYSDGTFSGGEVNLDFTLRAPDQRMPGTMSGFTFTGTSVPASDGWVATGTTRIWPNS